HVWLNQQNPLHITDDIFVSSTTKEKSSTVNIDLPVQNQSYTKKTCTTETWITNREGKKIMQSPLQNIVVDAGATIVSSQKININNANLWSINNPYLYRVIAVVKQNGTTIDSIVKRIGIRSIDIKANGVFINGRHEKIKGINCHQDHAGVGSALPDYLQYYRIDLLKKMGVNAYRTSHHAPTPELLDACDSLGMLVLDEQRLLNSSPEYMSQFERLIKRDRNHASVFLWSIGNEEGWIHTNDFGKRIAQTLIAKQKELDPTRTSTYAADVANVFKGVNEVIPVRGFNYRQFAVADYHNDHPMQPIIGTEMGSTVTTRGIYEKDSIRGYVPDQDITAPWWASKAETWWQLAASNDYWLGGFVWTGFDYRGEPTPFQWPNINSHFGIMDMCGFPKNIYYYYQSWWTDKDVLHISPHWNWRGKEGKPIDVWVNTNADNAELFLNGKSLGKKEMPRNGHLQWTVNFEPGKLEAVAYKNGKKLTAKVETTNQPVEVVITPYKTTILADGKDATIINVSVMDKDGREVPDADNLIRFSIQGDAKIIGVGNGDPSSHEPDKCVDGTWQRALFNGKCQVIVQAGKTPSFIKFQATATGLWNGSTEIVAVSSANAAIITNDKNYTSKTNSSSKEIEKMIGADISFLPELEDKGVKFSDKGETKDAIEILKDHGFNYIRLRIFNEPANDSGYSPKKGFCDLEHTKQMAKRIKAAGMKLLLDFHYSDYWADPGKQYKPAAWKNLSFVELKKAVFDYTKKVLLELKEQGTLPDMVQAGNEINHGMLWPDGSIGNIDKLAQLINAGNAAVKEVDASIAIMVHIALGGQNSESEFFLDNMIARNVKFDLIGESYYPKWHGTLDDLRDNLTKLALKYNKDVVVVEYSQLKEAVNKIAFELPNNKGKGTFIWEPLSTWESVFEKNGVSNKLLLTYDNLSKQYLKK
ncbi:MAG: glycosyl hydrolase 53 family protein, partial [Chitinophagaceae bacterium]|nr:glycosyl hydrolase 53 family protein [Chitinophagaceae bacterium]